VSARPVRADTLISEVGDHSPDDRHADFGTGRNMGSRL